MLTQPVIIDFYSDILCIWSWVAQSRIERLEQQYGDKIIINHRLMDVFGDTHTKINLKWAEKGGFDAFAHFVQLAMDACDDVSVNKALWTASRPSTSASAHVFIKAVELEYGPSKARLFTRALREAFFTHTLDISQWSTLKSIAHDCGFEGAVIESSIESGQAFAALMFDYQSASNRGLKGSPTWVLDKGQQLLFGNVEYAIITANIDARLVRPITEASSR